jgi:hypothetical protein
MASNAERRRGRREVSTEANEDNEEEKGRLRVEARDAKGVLRACARNFAKNEEFSDIALQRKNNLG